MAYANGHVEKLSVEKLEPILVQPAAKTNKGLYFLSNLDQTFPYPIEILFTYKGDGIGKGMSTKFLKETLAKTLVDFYPFAGCLTTTWDGRMIVRCTGKGVPFVEAFSRNNMEDILGDIHFQETSTLRKFMHYIDGVQDILDVPLLTVQVTRFKCGGIVLGVAFNHVLVDGRAFAHFMNCWAEVARGVPLSIHPYLDPSLVYARQPPIVDIAHDEYLKKERVRKTFFPHQKEKLARKSFCFDSKKFSQLKKLAADNDLLFTPSKFELISALVWIGRTKAYKIKPDETTQILTAVDGRPKFRPPLPKGYFANGIAWSCAQSKAKDLTEKPFSYAVKLVHEALEAVTDDYIRSAIDCFEVTREQLENENTLWITKWSRLPFYETDFGFGKPSQVGPASLVDNLVVTPSQGKDSDDIVLQLSLPVSAMKIFQDLVETKLKEGKIMYLHGIA